MRWLTWLRTSHSGCCWLQVALHASVVQDRNDDDDDVVMMLGFVVRYLKPSVPIPSVYDDDDLVMMLGFVVRYLKIIPCLQYMMTALYSVMFMST